MADAKRPNGVQIDITDSQQIVLKFDHGEIPPIQLTMAGAEQVGTNPPERRSQGAAGGPPMNEPETVFVAINGTNTGPTTVHPDRDCYRLEHARRIGEKSLATLPPAHREWCSWCGPDTDEPAKDWGSQKEGPESVSRHTVDESAGRAR